MNKLKNKIFYPGNLVNPRFTVIVPFYNSQETIKACLEALAMQHSKPSEIILVDNGSSDTSLAVARGFKDSHPALNIILLNELKRGPSAARNKGLSQATGDIIVFTDSDCLPQPQWIEKLLTGFSDCQIGAVAGRIIGANGQSLIEKFHAVFTLKGLREPETFSEFTLVKGGFPTANLAVRKDLFDLIHGFDEQMRLSAEDYDLCARIYKAGFRIKYIPEAIVYHKHRNTLLGTWKQSFGFGIGHAALLKKHFNKMLIVDLPKYQYISQRWPIRAWIDLAGLDKKLFGLSVLSFIWWPMLLILIWYLIFLHLNIGFRLRCHNLKAGFVEKWGLVLLLIFKSSALTCGRITESIRKRVLCF